MAWTNLMTTDVFLAASAGRSLFRPEDLLRLVELIQAQRGKCKGNSAVNVKENRPRAALGIGMRERDFIKKSPSSMAKKPK
jgi:hypothetical protein